MGMRTNRKGTAAVEFALVAPLLCGLIVGMLEIGRALQVQMVLTNAVREGCRGYCDNPTTVTLDGQTYKTDTVDQASAYAIALVKYSLKSANIGINAGNINSVTVTAPNPTTTSIPGTTSTAGTPISAQTATVTATMPYSLIAYSPPFIMGSRTLTASVTMRKP